MACDELDFFGQKQFRPSPVNDPVYRTFVAFEAFDQLFDITALFVQPIDFRGLGRFDYTGGLFEDWSVGMGVLVIEQRVSDGFVTLSGPGAYPVYNLVAG